MFTAEGIQSFYSRQYNIRHKKAQSFSCTKKTDIAWLMPEFPQIHSDGHIIFVAFFLVPVLKIFQIDLPSLHFYVFRRKFAYDDGLVLLVAI
ncbi:hypothetical protein skT53_09350 [Effusibacillus dendaii]|uniref:Uncharacterized protein n=1 Tax=Effusibacillus dendaii TaxID=2743772 RepID=A0A7I8DBQ6_9BACL|nr:hypothetical protein skT53_09350 [Effusibacillus dendaii]